MTEQRRLVSTYVSGSSAAVLLVAGSLFLFAPDALLPVLVPGIPREGAWLGQLVAAGWLAIAALNWLTRRAVVGGIYGRPVVLANTALYVITTTALLKIVTRPAAPGAVWLLFVPGAALAAIYAWLLVRGPFAADLARHP